MEYEGEQLLSARVSASGLTDPSRDVIGAVRHIGAVQAQLLFGAQMAVHNRSIQGNSGVEELLNNGDLVISWLNRGTLHLVAKEDFWNFQELTAPARLRTLAARFKRFGVDDALQNRVIERFSDKLSAVPLVKNELAELMELETVNVPSNLVGIVAASFLELASAHGLLVRGPVSKGEPTYVSAERWVAKTARARISLAGAAEQYAQSHFGSSADDFAQWLGIGKREAMSVWAGEQRSPTTGVWTGLLGPFDPLLHGWQDRKWILKGNVDKVISNNGVFRPTLFVRNKCVGLWNLKGGKISFDLFEDVSSDDLNLLHISAETIVTEFAK